MAALPYLLASLLVRNQPPKHYARLQNFHTAIRMVEETASWLEASLRASISATIASRHYRFVSHCVLWNIPAHCMWLPTYQPFLLLWPAESLKRLHLLQKIFTYTSPTTQIIQITSISTYHSPWHGSTWH